jgi:predicted ATPase
MIKQVSLQNVRLFADDLRTFRLAPLTVFCGSNSTGKSTILKIFPLLRQSQGIRESAEEESGKLRFKGTQVDLGNYSTLVSNNETSRKMQIGIRVGSGMLTSLEEQLRLIKGGKPLTQLQPQESQNAVDSEFDCSFDFSGSPPEKDKRTLSQEGNLASGMLLKAVFKLIVKDETLLEWSIERLQGGPEEKGAPAPAIGEPVERLYKFFLPTSYAESIGMTQAIRAQKSEQPKKTTFICALKGLLPTTLIAEPATPIDDPAGGSQHVWQTWPVPPTMEWELNNFRNTLFEIHYLAPLRSAGKRFYVADSDTSPTMDPTGEFLPFILQDKRDTRVIHALPSQLGKGIEQPLGEALGFWLKYLRTGNVEMDQPRQAEFELTTPGVLVELKLKSLWGECKHSLADSGFGYSQIVPVLIRGLLLPQNGTLVIEQPELHLHPALQVRIADFFLAMCSIGKQVILETHSEHLVNALRVKAAEDTENKLHQQCKIYFLSSDTEQPQVYDLSVQADGSLKEWPESFFGEALTLSGRLLRAQSKMKKIKN